MELSYKDHFSQVLNPLDTVFADKLGSSQQLMCAQCFLGMMGLSMYMFHHYSVLKPDRHCKELEHKWMCHLTIAIECQTGIAQ